MATVITSECINCGACEPECPNTAIYQGGVEWQAPDGAVHAALSNDIFYIVPEKCTECVGFFDHEACAAVCPVDCCVPDPQRPESEAVLLERARALHPDKVIPDDAPSRFSKDGAAPAAAPAGGAAPAAVAPAARPAAAAPAPVAAAVAVSRRVEKAVARPSTARTRPTFAGELPVDFEQLVADLGAPRRRRTGALGRLGLTVLAAGQGVLGALPAGVKRELETAVSDRRFFNAALATAANIMLNLLLYPAALLAFSVASGRTGLFSQGGRWWIFLGMTVAVVEAMARLRESIFRGRPFAEVPLRGALYGLALWPVGRLLVALIGARGSASAVGFDGYYGGRDHFDDKLERERRYGQVYRLEDRDDAYLLRVEFPRAIPPSSLADELRLPGEMPDYDYALSLRDGCFVVHGRVTDPQVRKLTAAAPAFPPEFTTRIPLRDRVAGFQHRYRDKTLEVVLPKAAG